MRTENERDLLHTAPEAFNRKIVMISKDFPILAAAGIDVLTGSDLPLGPNGHLLFCNRPEPYKHRPAPKGVVSGKPALRERAWGFLGKKQQRACLGAEPIAEQDGQERFTSIKGGHPASAGITGTRELPITDDTPKGSDHAARA